MSLAKAGLIAGLPPLVLRSQNWLATLHNIGLDYAKSGLVRVGITPAVADFT
jgi:hypothetical protein